MNWADLEIADLEPYQVEDCKMQDHHIILIMNREKTSTIRSQKYDYAIGQLLRMKLEKKDAFIYAIITGIDEIEIPHDLNKELLDREGNYDSVDEFYEELQSIGFNTDKFPRTFSQYDIEMVDAFKKSEDPWHGKEHGKELVEQDAS